MEVNQLSESDRSLLEKTRDFLQAHPFRRCYLAYEDGYRDADGSPTGQDGLISQCSIHRRHLGCPHLFDRTGEVFFWANTYVPSLNLLLSHNFLSQQDYALVLGIYSELHDADQLMRASRCGTFVESDTRPWTERLIPIERVLEVQKIVYPGIIDPLYDKVESLQAAILEALEKALSS